MENDYLKALTEAEEIILMEIEVKEAEFVSADIS